MSTKGNGAAINFLREQVEFDGPDCLIWPFNRGAYGYGSFGLNGEVVAAHRWMCEAVHGPAPTLFLHISNSDVLRLRKGTACRRAALTS